MGSRDVPERVDPDQDGESVRDRDPRRSDRLRGLLLHDGADAEENESEGADRLREKIPRALIHSTSPA